MKKLSIIIPVYNVEKYVEKCLRSCAEQDLPSEEYEIIVVNDGTRDNSLEIVEIVAKDYSNIQIYSQENAGLSAARNKGLSIAKGEYIWFIDSDDWIEKNCLNKITHKCIECELDILGICSANIIDNTINRRFKYNVDGVLKGKDFLIKYNLQHCVPFSIYRRQFLFENNLHFFEGIFHEDSEFTPRSYYYAERIAFLNDILYFVYQNTNSITRSVNHKKAFDCIVVASSLSKFSQSITIECKNIFDDIISLMINNSLNNSLNMNKIVSNELNDYIYENKYIFKHLIGSSRMKYRLEGVLFYLFPKYTIYVYKLIQKLNF